jgi:hypothetical protein
MIIRVDHTQMAKTAAVLAEHSTGLQKSIERMRLSLEPLYQNWYVSDSATGTKVKNHELLVDQAVGVITTQLADTGEVIAAHSADLRKTDGLLAGG